MYTWAKNHRCLSHTLPTTPSQSDQTAITSWAVAYLAVQDDSDLVLNWKSLKGFQRYKGLKIYDHPIEWMLHWKRVMSSSILIFWPSGSPSSGPMARSLSLFLKNQVEYFLIFSLIIERAIWRTKVVISVSLAIHNGNSLGSQMMWRYSTSAVKDYIISWWNQFLPQLNDVWHAWGGKETARF